MISTGDKDFAQLVRPGITLTNTMTAACWTMPGYLPSSRAPEQIVDYRR